ncbi:hypothetical protein BU24DRAFT_28046 [Aaosphaeria arxii CBS 175.79]|uniref:Uncharacterized protein n=1 Tax=Aaosphaeria arxii CBS 175.79 TaxID=1450172 RepID=A0A6A5YAZ4_9PLEO|nr:uncharacterized protein BU24DRAFT_28046 [Aaosphaeria arxii CBS 175.79]KAF2021764.1 hypothetical protein BU24DRAFT_28046 [Aaosphaeria arxii CBS 175.79]
MDSEIDWLATLSNWALTGAPKNPSHSASRGNVLACPDIPGMVIEEGMNLTILLDSFGNSHPKTGRALKEYILQEEGPCQT